VILRLRQLCDHGCLIPANAGLLNPPEAVVPNAPPSAEALARLMVVLRAGGLDDCCICLAAMHSPVVGTDDVVICAPDKPDCLL
jgi:SWI/SNF-related matrix-associated actin-dependent regulator of chromatin subfamily A3